MPQQRQEYLEQFGRSGLSPAEFCRRVKLCPATLSLWRRKPKAAIPIFAEVQVSTPGAASGVGAPVMAGAAVLHLREGAKLEVALTGEAAWTGLGLMLKTLQA